MRNFRSPMSIPSLLVSAASASLPPHDGGSPTRIRAQRPIDRSIGRDSRTRVDVQMTRRFKETGGRLSISSLGRSLTGDSLVCRTIPETSSANETRSPRARSRDSITTRRRRISSWRVGGRRAHRDRRSPPRSCIAGAETRNRGNRGMGEFFCFPDVRARTRVRLEILHARTRACDARGRWEVTIAGGRLTMQIERRDARVDHVTGASRLTMR